MSKKIKWTVLGSCGIAKRRTIPEGIIPADNAKLISIYDVNKEDNGLLAKELGVANATNLDELLDCDSDVVYIATPAYLHYDQVIACAKAGKHILCEKPLGMNIKEAEEMVAFCKDANVILGTAFMMRFQSQHQQALQIIKGGKLGKPVYARAQLSCWYPPMKDAWRQDPKQGGGGSLMDMGGHCIDLLEMFFGKVKRVSCFTNNTIHDYKSEDSAVATLFFENGAIGVVDTFFCIPDNSSKNVLELYGSGGSILAKGTIGQGAEGQMFAYIEDLIVGYDAKQSRGTDDGIEIRPAAINTYRAEIEEFSRAIIEGDVPANNAHIGLCSQKTLDACYNSAQNGYVIEIN